MLELITIFYEVSLNYSKIFVIVDGVDEIVDRHPVLDFFDDLLRDHGTIFKTFVASRPEVDIEHAFQSYMIVAITQSEIESDLQTYVRKELERLQISKNSDVSQDIMVAELVNRARGMLVRLPVSIIGLY